MELNPMKENVNSPSDAGLNKDEVREWNKLVTELMVINERMAFLIKRMQELDAKVIQVPEARKIISLEDKVIPRVSMGRMDKGNSFA